MRCRRKNKIPMTMVWLMTTAILILVMALCMAGTVFSMEKRRGALKDSKEQTRYTEHLEQEYVSRIRDLLKQEGYRNSGITMTKVFSDQETAEYTIMVHHDRIEKLSAENREQLQEKLLTIRFDMNCQKVSYQFL